MEHPDMQIGLNEKHPSPAYHAGRFLALCQHAQDLADSEVNSTYVDRFYRAASSTPAAILSRVYATARHRLKQIKSRKVRHDLEAAMIALNQRYSECWPHNLNTRQQAEFHLGYFHQSAVAPRTDRRKRFLTDRGESVQSFGERAIANVLFSMPAEEARSYEYERLWKLTGYKDGSDEMKPDFTVESAAPDHRFLYIEYTGMVGDSTYDEQWDWKSRRYRKLSRTIDDCMADGGFTEHTVMQICPSDLHLAEQFSVRLQAAVTTFLRGEATPELQEAWRSGVAPPETPW